MLTRRRSPIPLLTGLDVSRLYAQRRCAMPTGVGVDVRRGGKCPAIWPATSLVYPRPTPSGISRTRAHIIRLVAAVVRISRLTD